MARVLRVQVTLLCRCGAELSATLGGAAEVTTVPCPQCHRVYRVSAQANAVDISDVLELLPRFRRWLVEERGLSADTARAYERIAERWLRGERRVKTIAPLEWLRRYLVEVEGWPPSAANAAIGL